MIPTSNLTITLKRNSDHRTRFTNFHPVRYILPHTTRDQNMPTKFNRSIFLQFVFASCFLFLAPMFPTHAATISSGDLIKGTGAAVYYYGQNGKRYVFPNDKTYFTWYLDFSSVKTITAQELAAIPIGGNVTYRPGVKLVKIVSDPKVYAVSRYGVLHWITTEDVARSLYGSAWNMNISDVPDAFFANYFIGSSIASSSAYSPETERASVVDIQDTIAVGTPDSMTCPDAQTLESFVTCIVSHGGPFIQPTSAEQSDFRTVVRAMLNGACEKIPLPKNLAGIYSTKKRTDTETKKSYCAFVEIMDADRDGKIDRGWGTVIVDNSPKRELSIAIAHPVDDAQTEDQGIGLFKKTESRVFLLAGARRYVGATNGGVLSTCQPDDAHSSSDAAHNTATMFFAATQEINAWYGGRMWHQLQFHGMAAESCAGVDLYITHGLTASPAGGGTLRALKSNLLKQHPSWRVSVPGDAPSCSLNATTNVQGRYLNGVDAGSVCGTGASTSSEKFFSIEQAPGFRRAEDWIAAVQDTWPAGGGGTVQSTYFTSYGYNDNDDGMGHVGTAVIAYPSSHHPIATEGLGTFNDPITFATDPREIPAHTMIYVTYLQKYFFMEDGCGSCTTDWNNGNTWRTDLFMGGNNALQPEPALANCEAYITRNDIMYINAGPGYTVDTTPLFSNGVCTARLH